MTSAIIHRTVPMGKTSAVGNITPREARLNSDELPQLLLQLGDLFLQVRGGLQGGIGADLRDEFPRGGTPQRAAELPAGNGEGFGVDDGGIHSFFEDAREGDRGFIHGLQPGRAGSVDPRDGHDVPFAVPLAGGDLMPGPLDLHLSPGLDDREGGRGDEDPRVVTEEFLREQFPSDGPADGAGRLVSCHADNSRSAPARSYFTLPAVRPPTRRFSMSMNRIMTGTVATIEPPNT